MHFEIFPEELKQAYPERKIAPETTGKLGVWIDSPMLDLLHGEGYVKAEFPGKCMQFGRHGIDISKEPLLVYPTRHYQNGGMAYRNTGETSIPDCTWPEKSAAGCMARTG